MVLVTGPYAGREEAFAAASGMIDAAAAERRLRPLEVIADYVIPPADGPPTRDFQTLHFDFGVPLAPVCPADVARFTALHISAEWPRSGGLTRLVRLDRLLGQRRWASHEELLQRFASYGASHGAWEDGDGYTEGSLARIVEAAAGGSPRLPSVKADPGFLCGNEFARADAELDFLEGHGLSVSDVELELELQPGQLLVFDNLVLAHGRRGVRRPGELRQRVFGHRALDVAGQRELRDELLLSFEG